MKKFTLLAIILFACVVVSFRTCGGSSERSYRAEAGASNSDEEDSGETSLASIAGTYACSTVQNNRHLECKILIDSNGRGMIMLINDPFARTVSDHDTFTATRKGNKITVRYSKGGTDTYTIKGRTLVDANGNVYK